MQTRIDPDNILFIPPPNPPAARLNPQAPVLEDVIVMPASDSVSTSGKEFHPAADEDGPLSLPGLTARADGVSTQPLAAQGGVTKENDATAEGASQKRRPGRDKYSLGIQMLHVSPVWLLVGGLAFVALIAAGNWAFQTATRAQNGDATRPSSNRATNQSVAAARPNSAAPKKQAAAGQPNAAAPAQSAQKPSEEAKASAPKAETAAATGAAVPNQESGRFTLQVGSYNDAAEADNRASSLKASGLEGRVAKAEIPNRGTWYRVQVGRFKDREEAARVAEQLKAKGVAQSVMVTEVQP